MNNIKDIKDAKKRLNNYKYVMEITRLTPIEKEILSKKYVKYIYKRFPFVCNKASSINEVTLCFQKHLYKVEQFIKNNNNIKNINIGNQFQQNALIVTGTKSLPEKILIKRHKANIKNLQQIKDNSARIAKEAKARRIEYEKRVTLNNQKNNKIIICASSDDAKEIITRLKSQFNI